jgi:VWFA-related protein
MSFRRANFFLILLSSLFAIYSISAVAEDTVRATVSATKGGTPVSNLTLADFGVKDSGKPRTVTAFTAPTLKAAVPERLQANEFSDISDARETGGAIFVVLDTIHTRYEDERDARIQILKFLAKAAQSKHAVTLAILREKGLRVFHNYRTGSDVLLAALVKTGLGGMKGMTAPSGVNEAEVNAEAARLTAFSKGEESNPATPEQMRLFVDLPMLMFQEVALSADGLPGRKMLVWVTNEVPLDIDSKT